MVGGLDLIKKFPLLRKAIRKGLVKAIRGFGADFQSVALDSALERCKNRVKPIGTVIDVGASDGRWTQICYQYFPDAFYYLIEAQAPHEPKLKQLKQKMAGKLDYSIAAAADKVGQVYFDASDLQGGIASYQPFLKNCITLPSTTIDYEANLRNLKPPFLIKMDTHGFELPILSGAPMVLQHTSLIVIEAYNFNFSEQNVRFHDLVLRMEDLGFRCVDICDPLFRPFDHALWQFDLFFEPITSATFQRNNY